MEILFEIDIDNIPIITNTATTSIRVNPSFELITFAQRFLNVKVSRFTIRRHLNSLGLRLGDFREIPLERNTQRCIYLRREYAKTIETMLGPITLLDAIYVDEAGLERVVPLEGLRVEGVGAVPSVGIFASQMDLAGPCRADSCSVSPSRYHPLRIGQRPSHG